MTEEFIVRNEFAHVLVKLDCTANGMRLMIRDIRTGKVNYLDPLELESLAWSDHEDLKNFMDPSLTRWKDPKPSNEYDSNE